MGKRFRWNKWGKLWVYEGDLFVIAGNDEMGYDVMDKSSKVEIKKPDIVKSNYRGFYGSVGSKKEALDALRMLEQASKVEGLSVFLVGGSKIHQERGGFSVGVSDTGATILISSTEHPEDLVHEYAHYTLGHTKKRRYRTLEQEKRALEVEVGELKKLNRDTPRWRRRRIKLFATYLKGDEEEAKRILKEIEAKAEGKGETILPGVVLDALK